MNYYLPALLVASYVAKVLGLVTWGWVATALIPLGFGIATMALAAIPVALATGIVAGAVAAAKK